MKIAYFGGSFSPVTTAHIEVAEKVIEGSDIDEVWMSPCYKSLYGKKLIYGEHRSNMIKIACKSSKHPDKIRYCNWDLRIATDGKTYNTVYPMTDYFYSHSLYIVIGGDNVDKVPSWYKGEELINEYKFITVPRKGYTPKTDWWKNGDNKIVGDYESASDVSSTDVRRQLKEGLKEIKGLDIGVHEYIIKHNLRG